MAEPNAIEPVDELSDTLDEEELKGEEETAEDIAGTPSTNTRRRRPQRARPSASDAATSDMGPDLKKRGRPAKETA